MTMTGLRSIDTSIHKTNAWIAELARDLQMDNRQHALTGLRSGLHALRDRLPVEQSAHLAAQLPIVVRGLYFEGWRPSTVPAKIRDKQQFLQRISEELSNDGLEARSEDVARATFRLLARHLSPGAAQKLCQSLPEPIRELWPE